MMPRGRWDHLTPSSKVVPMLTRTGRRRWMILAALGVLLVPAMVRAQGTTPTGPAVTTPVPILLYHHIATAPRHTPAAQATLYVPAAVFRRQLAAVSAAGYEAVTLDQVFAAWRGEGTLPDKPVVLSFDDGYGSQYRSARPVLKAHGWPGVLNLIVNNRFPDPIPAGQVRSLIAAGWELDAHTLSHPDLTKIPREQMVREVADSRTQLQQAYDQPVDFLAYPYGHVNAAVAAAVRNAGYLGATTTASGIARPTTDPDRLPRIIVSPKATPARLVKQLGG